MEGKIRAHRESDHWEGEKLSCERDGESLQKYPVVTMVQKESWGEGTWPKLAVPSPRGLVVTGTQQREDR